MYTNYLTEPCTISYPFQLTACGASGATSEHAAPAAAAGSQAGPGPATARHLAGAGTTAWGCRPTKPGATSCPALEGGGIEGARAGQSRLWLSWWS